VGDIVEAAKNLNRSVMSTWEAEKLELVDKADVQKKYFVRIKGDESLVAELSDVFGEIQVVKVDFADEFGFMTGLMSEAAYEASAAKFPGICHMIRVEA
jgi:homoserine dehydrogenase